MNKLQIKIYSTPSCQYCHMAKEYFKSLGLDYESYDVSTDIERQKEMVQLTGALSVPVIVINGEVTTGFDKRRIDALLNHAPPNDSANDGVMDVI